TEDSINIYCQNYMSTDFASLLKIIDLNINYLDFDDISKFESEIIIKILSESLKVTPDWIRDTFIWIDEKENKKINIVFERENESLSAAKRLAESEIKYRIDSYLIYIFDHELKEAFKETEIQNNSFYNFLKFEMENYKFNINNYFKDSYWQYIIVKNNDLSISFYRYYIYISFEYKLYQDLRNQFLIKLHNQKNEYKFLLEKILNFFKINI
ncbi:MAG: hypothetical protein ACK4YF_04010, partial [Exilispira sp.]